MPYAQQERIVESINIGHTSAAEEPNTHLNVVFRMAPITTRVKISEVQRLLQAMFDLGNGPCNLTGDEGGT
jgi:hypothetical protein